ncbi:MAG TPA: T9SS type A sorting domain-containing protein [Bacteroidia bacterium]|nr:T9SS type A sorting domain-containing protein [Bacteroidia bacterium]
MKNALLFLTASLWCITLSAQPGWQWGYEAGGPGNDLGYAIKTNANGTSYITGRFNATATFGMNTISSYGGPDVFVAKYTVNGNCLWAVHGGSTEMTDPYGDEANGIDLDDSGACYVTGNFWGQATFGSATIGNAISTVRNIFLVKYDPSGNVVWAVSSSGNMSNCYSRAVRVDNAGNIWITGYLGGNAVFGSYTLSGPGGYAVKYDSNGNVLFATKIGSGSLDLYGITSDNSGSIYVTGYLQGSDVIGSVTYTSTGMRDAAVVKLNASGTVSWVRQSQNSSNTVTLARAISCDPQNGVYITGNFESTALFGSTTLTAPLFGTNCFIAKLDTAGTFTWAQQSTGACNAYAITTDQNSQVYITGNYGNTISFGAQTLNNNSTGSNAFIAIFEPAAGVCLFAIASTGQNPGAFAFGISTDNLGGTYITGTDKAPVIFGTDTTLFIGGEDVFIAKLFEPEHVGIENISAHSSVNLVSSENNFLLVVNDEHVMQNNPVFILYDMTGKEVIRTAITSATTTISSAGLATGIYSWHVINASGFATAGKISRL